MRKVYLLITSALMLLSSSTLWATDVATVIIDGNDTHYAKFADALGAWKSAPTATLRLDADVTYSAKSSGAIIAPDASTTKIFDLNGKKLTISSNQRTPINVAGANLTITNGTLEITSTYAATANKATGINIATQKNVPEVVGTLSMDDVVYTFSSDVAGTYSKYALSNNAAGCTLNLNNTTVTANAAVLAYGIYSNKGAVNTNGSSISSNSTTGGSYGMYLSACSAILSGTTVSASAEEGEVYGIYGINNNTSITISEVSNVSAEAADGDAYGLKLGTKVSATISESTVSATTSDGVAYGVSTTSDSKTLTLDNPTIKANQSTGNSHGLYLAKDVTLANGTFEADSCVTKVWLNGSTYTNVYITGGTYKGKVKTNAGGISGGQFSLKPSAAYIAEGKKAQYDEETKYYKIVEGDVVATVGDVEYTNLKDALDASSEETPAVLAGDVTRAYDLTLNDNPNKKYYLNLNGHTLSSTSGVFSLMAGELNIGNGKIVAAGIAITVVGSTEDVKNYSTLNVSSDVTIEANFGIRVWYDPEVKTAGKRHNSFGVTVNFAGKMIASTGITINGSIQKVPSSEGGTLTNVNVPIINIADGAEITGGNTDACCLYMAGYGKWNVGNANLTADNPVHIKAGEVMLDGTTINATRETYRELIYDNNGYMATGNAITVESNPVYAGNVLLTILNGSKIVSKSGYAFEEGIVCVTENDCTDKTKQIGLTVVDGAGAEGINAFSGAKGTMTYSESFAKALEEGSIAGGETEEEGYTWVQNSIIGGKYSAMPEVVADGYEVVITSDPDFPYAVQKEHNISGDLEKVEKEGDDDKNNIVEVENGKAYVVKTGTTYEVGGLLIAKNNATVSQLIVEPGATLIVGRNGIVIGNTTLGYSALILETDREHGTGRVLFNGTTENSSPLATVEMYMKGKNNLDGTYIWQHFGLPMNANEVAKIEKTMAVTYNDWNIQKGWVPSESTAAVLNQGPWVGHNTTTNAVVEGGIFKFEGNIVGNINKEINLVYGYNCLANSYTAEMSIRKFIETLDGVNSDKLVWVYDSRSDEFNKYNSKSFLLLPDPGIDPMQAFFIGKRDQAAASITLNYNDVVYGFASTRDADATEYNGGFIKLSAEGLGAASLQILEGEEFSDEFEDGADGEQMETGKIEIYIEQGAHKLAAIATNSLESKEITIVTKGATEYTLSFENLIGNAFKLTDMASGAEIEVGADKTYTFTAEANSTIKRFKLGEGEVSAYEAEANSAVSIWAANGNVYVANNEAAADIEIYNLSGVKIAAAAANGEAIQAVAISSLASGVYIVRVGEASAKVVK